MSQYGPCAEHFYGRGVYQGTPRPYREATEQQTAQRTSMTRPASQPNIDVTDEITGGHQAQAPAYSGSGSPPPYTADAAVRDLLGMRDGDPNETISVPFVHSDDKKSFKDYLAFRNVGTVTRRIIARPMSRRLYNERYAHDANGNFIGTGKMAPDAGLVFIPRKGTEQDLLDQVSKFAHARRNHDPKDFAFAGAPGLVPIGGGWGM